MHGSFAQHFVNLQIAEETVDIGSNTLVEVHRQGLQLERADHGIENMEKDVIEASRILKFMRRWCCFQVICCCDCFDADVDLTNTRKQRVKLRQQQRVVHDEHLQTRALGHQMSLQRENTLKDDIELNVNSTSMARTELLANRNNVNRDNISHIDANDGIGFGLPDQDREEIQQETRRQDAYLDRIGQAVENMKAISLEMQDELNRQDPEIDIISERIHQTHSNLGNLYRDARKI